MKKFFLLLLWILIPFSLISQERPFIWVKQNDRAGILDKIEKYDWARKTFIDLKNNVDKDIIEWQQNPEDFLKGMPFDWKNQKPGETPPFFYTIHVGNGQHLNLDNATSGEMANYRKLLGYLQTALDCGVVWYLTHEEKYAQCALDILNASVKGIIQLKPSDWAGRGGWLCPDDILKESREIGDKLPLIYDFIAQYINNGATPWDIGKQTKVNFPRSVSQQVFRTYADLVVTHGMIGSNHPVLESTCLVYNALALEDITERNKYLKYYLTESTPNQDALEKIAEYYREEGDTWPETSQYTNAVASISVQLMYILLKYDPSLNLARKYINIPLSLPKWDYLKYPNNEIVRFGDGKRTGGVDYKSYELAYRLGKMDSLIVLTSKFGSLLNTAISEGVYQRKGLNALLWFDDEFKEDVRPIILPRTDQLSHAGLFLQRNLSKTGKPEDGLMCFVGGAHMVHGHAEGMNIELYGRGQVLGVDNGRGNYAQDIHENYSRIFAAHNTVIVNGSSQGEGGWVNQGINTVQLKTMEPLPAKEAISPLFSFSKTTFLDDKGDKAEATQERTLALIRTSETSGYYVDVFRSKSALPDEYHDYLYHNIGDKLQFLNNDLTLEADPSRYQANANNPWIQNKEYRHPGWHFFEDGESSSDYSGDVIALFNAGKLKDGPINMKLFIPGSEQREYTRVMAPHTFEAPAPYDDLPTPTLVIRKKGEAWISPFIVVYEPFEGDTKNGTIQSVTRLEQNGIFKGLKIVSNLNQGTITQFVLVQSESETFIDKKTGIVFQGEFGLITLDGKNKLQNMYLGDGIRLAFKKTEITSPGNKAVGGYIDLCGKTPVIKVNGKTSIRLGKSILIKDIY